MFVVDVLLVCNLILLALCIVRMPRQGRSRLDDVLGRARLGERPTSERPTTERPTAVIVPFPAGDELARRRARTVHPSGHYPHPSSGLV